MQLFRDLGDTKRHPMSLSEALLINILKKLPEHCRTVIREGIVHVTRHGRRRRYAAAADKFDTPPPPINFDRRADCQIFA